MNVLNFINAFFSDSAHWHGYDGIPTRLGEHVEYTLEALALAAAIGLPIGLVTGHYGRGGNALVADRHRRPGPAQLRSAGADDLAAGLRDAAGDDPAGRPRRPADPGHHLRGDALRRPVAGGRRPRAWAWRSPGSCSRWNCRSRSR